MPRQVVPVRFVPDQNTGYIQDIGTEIAVNSRFVLPPDIPDTEISTILNNIGAQAASDTDPAIPCNDALGARLRKLVFIRSNGGSMSVPVGDRADLLNAATIIRGLLNSNGAEVVCIKLLGEIFPDLADDLGMNYQGDFATSHVPTNGGKQFYYTGNISYEADAAPGSDSIVFQPIKSITNNENAASSQLSAAWSGCVGSFTNTLACRGKGRRNPRKHRRYLLTFATKADPADGTEEPGTETAELPVSGISPADILACGQTAAGLGGAYCIGYFGESYSRYHKLLP